MAKHQRRTLSLAMQYALGVSIYGLARPFVWTIEKLGNAEQILGGIGDVVHNRLVAANPLGKYILRPQDVFVMTFSKSGTNWMLQIAQQLIHHGKAEFDHIHDIVPWPDISASPGFLSRYAIALEDATDWIAAPEKKRLIKTHF